MYSTVLYALCTVLVKVSSLYYYVLPSEVRPRDAGLRELHWLRMSQRIDYKLAVLVYRCLNGLAPSYLANDLQCMESYITALYRSPCPVCGGPRRLAVSSLSINEYTRRACDAPVNSRRPRVSGGRGSRVEQSAGRCQFVAIAVDIQETA